VVHEKAVQNHPKYRLGNEIETIFYFAFSSRSREASIFKLRTPEVKKGYFKGKIKKENQLGSTFYLGNKSVKLCIKLQE